MMDGKCVSSTGDVMRKTDIIKQNGTEWDYFIFDG